MEVNVSFAFKEVKGMGVDGTAGFRGLALKTRGLKSKKTSKKKFFFNGKKQQKFKKYVSILVCYYVSTHK